jgi:outer membrane lipoprotein-sorting protein
MSSVRLPLRGGSPLMTCRGWSCAASACVLLTIGFPTFAQDARSIIAEAQKRSYSSSQRYEGTLEVIGAENRVATKRWVFERIGSFGDSKALLRFTAPAEVKGVTLLIVNHPDKSSDQWMWRPEIGRDQRIALQDRSTRFFGTDFSFEDLEERDVNQFDYKLAGEETGEWKIESRPRKSSQYTYLLMWVKKDNYTITKVEAYGKKGLARVIEYRDFELNHNIWTARTTEVLDVARKSRTILKFDKLEYDVPLKPDQFTVEALRRES